MTDGTTLLFGLPGVRVERVERVPDGARVVHVVTDEPTAAACPVMWGGVHVGERPGDHIAEGHPLRSGSNCSAVEQDPVAMPGGLLRARRRSPRRSRRCRRGHGPPGGCAPRSARRSVMRPAQ